MVLHGIIEGLLNVVGFLFSYIKRHEKRITFTQEDVVLPVWLDGCCWPLEAGDVRFFIPT